MVRGGGGLDPCKGAEEVVVTVQFFKRAGLFL